MKTEKIRQYCIKILVAPIVRFAVKRAGTYQEFSDIVRKQFVEIAEDEIITSGKKINLSRLALITGMTRQDIKRVKKRAAEGIDEEPSVINKVLNRWEQDSAFHTRSGRPKTLSYKGENSEFRDLCTTVSKHLHPGTVMFELLRSGSAEKTSRGLRLVSGGAYVSKDAKETYELAADDFSTLMSVVEDNIAQCDEEVRHHHLRTEYDNIYEKDLAHIREWMFREGMQFHKRARDYISRYDRDIVLAPKDSKGRLPKGGGQVVLTGIGYTHRS